MKVENNTANSIYYVSYSDRQEISIGDGLQVQKETGGGAWASAIVVAPQAGGARVYELRPGWNLTAYWTNET